MTREDAARFLDLQDARVERVDEEIVRCEYVLGRYGLLDTLRAAEQLRREQMTLVERAAIFEQPETLAQAQAEIARLSGIIKNQGEQIVALEEKAQTDALTGVLNRAGSDTALSREWLRCRRTHAPLGLAFIDVDRFKDVNDRYGHAVGDQALRAIATVIAEESRRSGEVVGRWGGDEFVVIVPETDLPGTLALAGRVREAIARVRVTFQDAAVSLGASIGVSSFVPTASTQIEELYRRADAAVYEAKRRGRNLAIGCDVEAGTDVFFGLAPEEKKENLADLAAARSRGR